MTDIVNVVCDIIENNTEYTPVVGAMPPVDGIGIQQSSGIVLAEYLPRTELQRTTLVINAKNRQQEVALQTLVDIHKCLTKRIGYPSTADYQIVTIRVVNSPNFLGQENDETYMYGSAVEVIWYDRQKAEDTPL